MRSLIVLAAWGSRRLSALVRAPDRDIGPKPPLPGRSRGLRQRGLD